MPACTMPEPGFTSLSALRGPESCEGKRRVCERLSDRSLKRSEVNKTLTGGTADLVCDLTQEVRAMLEPLIPTQGSFMTIGASAHRVQSNHLVAGLTHALSGVRTLVMQTHFFALCIPASPVQTLAAISGSPFVPRTARPPYSHVETSTRAEPDQLRLTAMRILVDVEPYTLGGRNRYTFVPGCLQIWYR